MMATPGEKPVHRVQRILVALDALADPATALESAADLAARLHGELVGLFVEDVNIVNLASLPFSKQFSLRTGEELHLESESLQREFSSRAGRAREAMNVCCSRHSVKWSYRVVRGKVTEELLAASNEADILVMGRESRIPSRRPRLGSTAREIARRAPASVLLLEHGGILRGPFVVLFDGSPAAVRALERAAALAAPPEPFSVILLAENDTPGKILEDQARGILGPLAARTRFRRAPVAAPKIAGVLAGETVGTLVLNADSPLLTEPQTDGFLDRISRTILLVR